MHSPYDDENATKLPHHRNEEGPVFNEGYRAQAAGKSMVRDNPYCDADNRYWEWRSGYCQAFKDSN